MNELPEMVTLAQALVWTCTRDPMAVLATGNDQSPRAFKVQFLKYGYAEISERRVGRKRGESRNQTALWSFGKHGNSGAAMKVLEDLLLRGSIPCLALDVPSGRYAIIDPRETHGLELQIHPDSDQYQYGFWIPEGKFPRYVPIALPTACVLERFPPGGRSYFGPSRISKKTISRILMVGATVSKKEINGTAKDESDLMRILLALMSEARLSKQQARALCQAEFSNRINDRAFMRCWREVPKDLKIGVGKHGPKRL